MPNNYFFSNGINFNNNAKEIKEKFNVKLFNNQIWYYDKTWLCDFSHPIIKVIFKEYSHIYPNNSGYLKQIKEYLINDLENEPEPSNLKPVINFNNGFMDEEGFKPYKAEEERRNFKPYTLTFNYEEVKSYKLVDKFLDVLFSDKTNKNKVRKDIKEYVLAYCYTCFSAYCPKQFLVLTGTGNNGKTTFLNFLTAINGELNTGAFSSQSLSNRFSLACLYNKTYAVCDDANNEMLDASVFKQATGQGFIAIERKGENSFSAKLNSTIFLCSNYPIRYKDNSNALSSRLSQVALFRDFREADKDLCLSLDDWETLLKDRKAHCYFIKLCYEAFIKLWDKGFIKLPKEIQLLNEEIYKENNALYRFITETNFIDSHIEDNQLFIYPDFLYECFKDWYKEEYDKDKCPFSKDGLWKEFKTTLESKLRAFYDFDFSYENRKEQWIAGVKFKGYIIKTLNYNDNLTKEQLEKLQEEVAQDIKTHQALVVKLTNKRKELDKLYKDKFITKKEA